MFIDYGLTSHSPLPLSLPDVFFCLCLALMVASLLETIFITNLLSGTADTPIPHWIHVFVLQILGCLVRLPLKTKVPKVSGIQFICSFKGKYMLEM